MGDYRQDTQPQSDSEGSIASLNLLGRSDSTSGD